MIVTTFASSVVSDFFAQVVIAYVVFVLTSSSLGLWLAASYLSSRWKAYAIAMTFALAVIIIINNTNIPVWLAMTALVGAIIGPVCFAVLKPKD